MFRRAVRATSLPLSRDLTDMRRNEVIFERCPPEDFASVRHDSSAEVSTQYFGNTAMLDDGPG